MCQRLPPSLPPPSLLILPASLLARLFHFLSLPRLPCPCLLLWRPPPLRVCLPWRSPSVPLPSASIFRLRLPSLCPLMISIPEPPATSPRRGLSPSAFSLASPSDPRVGITDSSVRVWSSRVEPGRDLRGQLARPKGYPGVASGIYSGLWAPGLGHYPGIEK